MAKVAGREGCAAIVRPATDAKFGDYQVNGVMALAKQMKTNPRNLAEEVVKNLDLGDICEPPEVAGPGFVNLRLKAEFVAERLLEINKDSANLGIEKALQPKTIVVDFSSPNIAKQMHVGHLRSTIIGDCICRMPECLGHKVIRQNHIGDWGTQFGRAFLAMWHIAMGRKHGRAYYREELRTLRKHEKDSAGLASCCESLCKQHANDWREDRDHELGDGEKVFWKFVQRLLSDEEDVELQEIEVAYQYVTQLETAVGADLLTPTRERDPETGGWREKMIPYELLSRHVTVMLQKGGADNEQEDKLWRYLIKKTLVECHELYGLLSVTLDDSHVRGESFYNNKLADVVGELKSRKLAVESDGAVCVFPPGFKTKEDEPLPFIIQKSDGAYLYATTDLAALRYRVNELKADAIVYVTDARQKLHFEMLFAVARMAGWVNDKIELTHVMFGSVLGEDGAPLKTRSGENVKLKELLDEAVERAKVVVEEKNPDLPAEKKADIARAVGIGAVKYADYSNNRTSDYVFSFDKMLAMEGNTAPYMQYAYARIKSIERKAQSRDVDIEAELAVLKKEIENRKLVPSEVEGSKIVNLDEPAELDLAKHLIRYGEAIQAAVADYRPNYLTAYLYELSQKFSAFYTNCPVLGAGPDKRPTRLLLCDLTARTIRHGLHDLLGIEVVEQM
ncbi:MAG: arginine--tRNA ligase [Planctomycetes bacterium RBG_16_55_9]|nr:MAG: arginine--tRNA ligase [Planctomycetes bacterium RBG_16_55_9]